MTGYERASKANARARSRRGRSGVPVEHASARPIAQRRLAAVHPQPHRGDARRALGHRRDRGLGDPDQGRDHSRRRRRRYRLRHDGGAHLAHGQGSAGFACALARRDRAQRAARQRTVAAINDDAPCIAGRRATRDCGLDDGYTRDHRQAPEGRRDSADRRIWARSAAATTSSSSAWTKQDRVWVMLHSGSRGVGNAYRQVLHRAGAATNCCVVSSATMCRTRTSPSSWKASELVRRLRARGRLGARLRARQPRGDDGARAGALREQLPKFSARSHAVNCHHNYVAQGAPLRRGRVGDPQGRRACGRRRAWHHPWLDGREDRSSCAARATRIRSAPARTAQAAR